MRRVRSVEERFWSKVNTDGPVARDGMTQCWIWTACKHPDGHGKIGIPGRGVAYAHRVSYELHGGHIPEDMCICHQCDNPSCVNPSHLFLGTRADNTRDMWNKGRTGDMAVFGDRNGSRTKPESRPQGERCAMAKFRDMDVIRMREQFATGGRSYEEMAKIWNMSTSNAHRILSNKTWRHLLKEPQ